jgi:aryl carrier-like protein
MNLKILFIIAITALTTNLLTLWFAKSDNTKLTQDNELKKRTIDSLRMESNIKEYQLQRYEILFEELDEKTLYKIDSLLRNIE